MPQLCTPTQRTTGWFKYAATNIAADDTVPASFATTITETTPTKSRLIPFRGWRSLTLMPFGTDTANDDFYIYVFLVTKINTYATHLQGGYGDFNTAADVQWIYQLYTQLTCTLGATADGSAGAYLTNLDFTCDTVVASNDAYATAVETWTGRASSAYSPGGDALNGMWHAPDLLSPDFVYLGIDISSGTAATGANALCKLDV